MKMVIHPGHPDDDNGEMKRYTVRLKTKDKRVTYALQRQSKDPNLERSVAAEWAQGIYSVSVFACGPHGALENAKEKANDKWLRHRGWDIKNWTALDAVED